MRLDQHPHFLAIKLSPRNLLLVAQELPVIKFIKMVTDTTKFNKKFEEVLAWRLAADLCFGITRDATHAKNLYDGYVYELSQARSFDSMEGSAPDFVIDEWENSRF